MRFTTTTVSTTCCLLVIIIIMMTAEHNSHAFSSLRPTSFYRHSRRRVTVVPQQQQQSPYYQQHYHSALWDAPTETVNDVQEAVELLDVDIQQEEDEEIVGFEQDENAVQVQVNNEMLDPRQTISKQDLLNDVQSLMEAEPLVVLPDPETERERELQAQAESRAKGLVSDIAKKISYLDDSTSSKQEEENTDMDAAQISSSLYMNPATEKIAQHVKITWEPQVAETLSRLEKVSNPNRPFIVGIVGIPGSGKSTSAEIIQALLGEDRAMIMPMDGFHIPLAELAELDNAADAIYRRGAPDTFHAAALQEELHKIAYGQGQEHLNCVSIPGFDHAVGDPTPDQHTFHRDTHRIVLCEGLYLLHDDDGWEQIKSIFDWAIYIDADVDVCIERLKERNKCIPGYTPEEIEIRCDAVDRVNAETARDGAYKYASQIVSSGASS